MNKKLTLICLISLLAATASADDEVHPFISSKYSIQAGVFFPSKDFRLRVDGTLTGSGREFDFDETAGFSENDEILNVEFNWRFGKKWSLRLQHFASDESARAVLEEDIEWGDEIILAGSNVAAGADFALTRVFFGRSFDSRANVDTGIGLGLHWLEVGAFINANVNMVTESRSTASVAGPLPNVGWWYYYSPSPKWFVGGRVDWLQANIDKYDGGIWNVAAGVNYQMFKNVGVGVKYQLFRLGVDVDEDKWNGRVELDYDGLFVYLSANWK